MSMEFKKGDRLRCVDNGLWSDRLTIGKYYEFESMDGSFLTIKEDNLGLRSQWKTFRFEKADNPDTDYDESDYLETDV